MAVPHVPKRRLDPNSKETPFGPIIGNADASGNLTFFESDDQVPAQREGVDFVQVNDEWIYAHVLLKENAEIDKLKSNAEAMNVLVRHSNPVKAIVNKDAMSVTATDLREAATLCSKARSRDQYFFTA